jgi:hypothetical protein
MRLESATSIVLTASGAVMARPGAIHSAHCSGTTTLTLHDNATTNTGKHVMVLSAGQSFSPSHPIQCENGAYAQIAGTGSVTIVYALMG